MVKNSMVDYTRKESRSGNTTRGKNTAGVTKKPVKKREEPKIPGYPDNVIKELLSKNNILLPVREYPPVAAIIWLVHNAKSNYSRYMKKKCPACNSDDVELIITDEYKENCYRGSPTGFLNDQPHVTCNACGASRSVPVTPAWQQIFQVEGWLLHENKQAKRDHGGY